ncbi:hypothetical protein PIB30_073335 [Stylosanthes scabra]|uniref:Uncharacterized protein n=1 Tax=Stylosanthes scabra TaxID=79078 RepID=A0ABU6VND9_9FABA|nr:hypothetical protein [Stylosanthes scabra]
MSGPQGKRNHLKTERYDAIVGGSPKDLNHPKLYKQGGITPSRDTFSYPTHLLGYAEEHVTEDTSSYLDLCSLVPHSKSFGQSLRNPTLILAPWGHSYSRDKKRSARDLSGRWKRNPNQQRRGR